MGDVDQILSKILQSGVAGGVAGGLLGNALMSRTGQKVGRKVLGYGALAAVGGLAYLAWKKYSESRRATTSSTSMTTTTSSSPAPTPGDSGIEPPPAGSAFLPASEDTAARNELGLTLLRAMIGAAKADGRLDGEESRRVRDRVAELGLDADDQALVLTELANPVDLDALVSSATCPEVAAEIYVASRLAIDVDTPAERAYLQLLAARLALDPGLVTRLDHEIEAV